MRSKNRVKNAKRMGFDGGADRPDVQPDRGDQAVPGRGRHDPEAGRDSRNQASPESTVLWFVCVFVCG